MHINATKMNPRRSHAAQRTALGLGQLCVGLVVSLGTLGCGEEPGISKGADVVLISIDTLRADGLSSYGNPRQTSANLDRLAEEGILFEEVLTSAPNTATSHASLFTGLSPWTHRVANLTSTEDGTPGLPEAFTTLAERFEAAGYQTAAFTDGGPLGRAWNMHQGFQTHHGRYEGVRSKVDRALKYLKQQNPDQPLFLFVHTYEVHMPFVPPRAWIERFDSDYDGPILSALDEIRTKRAEGAELQPDGKLLLRDRDQFTDRDWEYLRALYDAGVGYTDEVLGELFDALRARPNWDQTIVAVTSDHGEEFGEHGEIGHIQLHRETLHVPLLLRLPDASLGRGRRVPDLINMLDLHATLLEAAGLQPEVFTASSSLLPLLRGEREAPRVSFAETTEPLYMKNRPPVYRRSVRLDGHAFLSVGGTEDKYERMSLYDIGSDPMELSPRFARGGEMGDVSASDAAARMAEHCRERVNEHLDACMELRSRLSDRLGNDFRSVGEAELDELERLGYLGNLDD